MGRPPRYAWIIAGACLLWPIHSSASSIPEPLFFGDTDEWVEHLRNGQFSPLQELHLTQYSTAPMWSVAWAEKRYQQSGLLASYGSTSGRRLHTSFDLALNLNARKDLRLRYDHRSWQDERFELAEERFDALWWPVDSVALLASGWPTHLKQDVAAGFGCYLGSASGGNGVSLLLRDDRAIFNEKTSSNVRFEKRPLRYLADAFSTFGSSGRLYATVNLGEPYLAIEDTGDTRRSAKGLLRYGDGGAVWDNGHRGMGWRLRFVEERHSETDETDLEYLSYRRLYWRSEWFGTVRPQPWSGTATLVYAQQRDAFEFRNDRRGEYRMYTWLAGLEANYYGWQPLGVSLGYLGGRFDAERQTLSGTVPSPAFTHAQESVYRDKAQLKARYDFSSKLVVEFLVSKEVSRGTFGGFSVKAIGWL